MTWEERWHPLREEWVIVAAHRQNRPWIGETRQGATRSTPGYDPECAFCPGNLRVGGRRNELYARTFVFDNDLVVLAAQTDPCSSSTSPTRSGR